MGQIQTCWCIPMELNDLPLHRS